MQSTVSEPQSKQPLSPDEYRRQRIATALSVGEYLNAFAPVSPSSVQIHTGPPEFGPDPRAGVPMIGVTLYFADNAAGVLALAQKFLGVVGEQMHDDGKRPTLTVSAFGWLENVPWRAWTLVDAPRMPVVVSLQKRGPVVEACERATEGAAEAAAAVAS